MPLIIAAYQVHQQDGLAVLAINLTDQEGSTKDARKFGAEFQMPFPVLLDEKGKARKLYALRGVPTSVFVGADGVVHGVNPGPIDQAALQQHCPRFCHRGERDRSSMTGGFYGRKGVTRFCSHPERPPVEDAALPKMTAEAAER
jgi:hypothetical protein